MAEIPQTDRERLTDAERVELDRLVAHVILPTFTEREREIARLAARAALAASAPPVTLTRVEVIGPSGRVLVARPTTAELSWQDNGRTLKVFVSTEPSCRPAPPVETLERFVERVAKHGDAYWREAAQAVLGLRDATARPQTETPG